ncbi:hypothetical protein LLEC1_07831 [Akanthomyces lecanii]|uniref:Uncharacterized protein n=1 Tax=Cordyceps confragosa TaxID=2714763 RepID=A0A179I8L8_CORDF|nr:hypothetical protein LLEC1_07831 [Akanthomyces lecanii]
MHAVPYSSPHRPEKSISLSERAQRLLSSSLPKRIPFDNFSRAPLKLPIMSLVTGEKSNFQFPCRAEPNRLLVADFVKPQKFNTRWSMGKRRNIIMGSWGT